MRANGAVQDCALPLADGAAVQFLTTRDKRRPRRALRAAPLERAPARRGGPPAVPGREDRDRPADRERLLLRLRVPASRSARRICERSRPRSSASSPRAASGRARRSRATRRGSASRPRASRTRSSSSTPPRARSRSTPAHDGGRFTDLCRGPHLQNSAPIKAFKLTGLAGAYWRGDEHNTQLTRIYGTAFYTQARPRRATSSGSRRRSKRDHRRLGAQLDLFHLSDALAGLAVLASEGDGDLEHARGPPPARERARAATSR